MNYDPQTRRPCRVELSFCGHTIMCLRCYLLCPHAYLAPRSSRCQWTGCELYKKLLGKSSWSTAGEFTPGWKMWFLLLEVPDGLPSQEHYATLRW